MSLERDAASNPGTALPEAALSADAAALPVAPEPAEGSAANPQREGAPWDAVWHQPRFSRIGIGADLSLMGIGIKAATPLNDDFDARFVANFFNFNSSRFEVDGFNLYANIHLASAGAALDLYPWNSPIRVSAGVLFMNGNQVSMVTRVAPGTSFTLGTSTFYSSAADPLTGTAQLNLHTVKPEPMVSFGFGRFVPHSNRHWSFPAEFGAVYMGAPALTVNPSGTVCTDQALTQCSSVNSTGNPVGALFNTNLQARLAKWRSDLDKVQFYPILTYSLVYSFNIR